MATYLNEYSLMVLSGGRANKHENVPIKRIDARNMHFDPNISQIRNTGSPHYFLWEPNVPEVVFHTHIHSNNLCSSSKSCHYFQLKLYLLSHQFQHQPCLVNPISRPMDKDYNNWNQSVPLLILIPH